MPARTILLNERIWIVKAFVQFGSTGEVRRRWPFTTPVPARSSISALAKKFDAKGDVRDVKRSGRKRTIRTPRNIAAISFAVQVTPRVSIRSLSLETGLKKDSIHKILRKDLNLKVYHPTEVSGLKPDDYQKRY